MTEFIKPTILPSLRTFLQTLGLKDSPYATPDELIGVLIERVRAQHSEPGAREALVRFLEELEADGTNYAAQIPCPECEVIDPKDLISEVEATLRVEPRRLFSRLEIISACALIVLFAAAQATAQEADCVSDRSPRHMRQLISQGAGVTPSEADQAVQQLSYSSPTFSERNTKAALQHDAPGDRSFHQT